MFEGLKPTLHRYTPRGDTVDSRVLDWLHSEDPTVLTDGELFDELAYTTFDVAPLTVEQVQPASIDLRLGRDFKRLKEEQADKLEYNDHLRVIDTAKNAEQLHESFEADSITLDPGDCVLATTKERVHIPPHLLGEVEGRSSFGRLFVEVHQTAGILDPGFEGTITLEVVNNNPNPVKLHAGQRVCQIVVSRLASSSEEPYGEKHDTKYQGQEGATLSRLHEDQT